MNNSSLQQISDTIGQGIPDVSEILHDYKAGRKVQNYASSFKRPPPQVNQNEDFPYASSGNRQVDQPYASSGNRDLPYASSGQETEIYLMLQVALSKWIQVMEISVQ